MSTLTFTEAATQPTHKHDCAHCIYLGTIEAIPGVTPGTATTEDLWAHERRSAALLTTTYELIHCYGDDDQYGTIDVVFLERGGEQFRNSDSGQLYTEIHRRLTAHLQANPATADA